ncbi:hypothetical protein SVAN01_00772 [Stagonosporopsis vannaccii]|nr:hypothetical protein SVAN01_00772 [Stagonosporopsis vannaccii]
MAMSGRHCATLCYDRRLRVSQNRDPFVQREFLWGSVDLPCPEARKAQPSGCPCDAGRPHQCARVDSPFQQQPSAFVRIAMPRDAPISPLPRG